MLQWFIHVCCKCIYLDVAYVSHWILQVFYLNVPYVCNGFSSVFSRVLASVSHKCLKCFICLLLYVPSIASGFLKVDRVLQGMRVGNERGRERSLHRQRPGIVGPVWAHET
jgi:hypothetical protein